MSAAQSISGQLREKIRKDGRSLYEIAKVADLSYSMVHSFVKNPEKKLHVESAEALAKALGFRLELKR